MSYFPKLGCLCGDKIFKAAIQIGPLAVCCCSKYYINVVKLHVLKKISRFAKSDRSGDREEETSVSPRV